ncbi:MAG: nuclear transport factor 2 family protein [Pseudomonadota bacterium]
MSQFLRLLARMTSAATLGDGAGVAACFTEDGTYHDVFYGSFRGREAICDLIEGHMHRDGADFRWDIHDPVSDDGGGYARYLFSYRSLMPESAGQRAVFEGVAIVRLSGDLISEYSEVSNAATGLSMLGMEDARLAKFIAKQARALLDRGETAEHL